MSAEFAKMLRVIINININICSKYFMNNFQDTLDKMQQRIEIVQWDNDIDPQKMKKIKGIAELN